MKIILMKRVSNLGMVGDIVEVKDGYARNFLIPRGLAIVANKQNLKKLENEKKVIEELRRKEEEESKSLAQKLKELELVIEVRVGETGRLYGSVTNGTISNELKKLGFDIDKKMIELKPPIKELGEYEVKVRLHAGIEEILKVKVVAKGESIEEKLKKEVETAASAVEEEKAEESEITEPEAGKEEEATAEQNQDN